MSDLINAVGPMSLTSVELPQRVEPEFFLGWYFFWLLFSLYKNSQLHGSKFYYIFILLALCDGNY